jgi:antitoxin MazE
MRASVARWGNSLAVRLPRSLAEDAHLSEGSDITLTAESGRIIVETARPRYALDDLLAQMKPEHRRGEVEWGEPAGGEVW